MCKEMKEEGMLTEKNGIAHHSVGSTFDGFLLIKDVQKGTASNGKPFLTLFLVDTSGEIDAKLWDVSKEDEGFFVAEKVVKVTGDIIDFSGKSQLRMKAIRLAQVSDNVRISDFLQKAPMTQEELQEKINEAIFTMTNPNVQRITRALVNKHVDKLFV